ncbi:hypothetical protein TNCV_1969941 [Trichonephila clavipes]|nr:hypothetical protein TNCV_1969941 [Trichonephila clavipes]
MQGKQCSKRPQSLTAAKYLHFVKSKLGAQNLTLQGAQMFSVTPLVKSAVSLNLPIDVVWKFREEGASSGVLLVTWPWFNITRFVTNSHRVAVQCDVTKHCFTPEFASDVVSVESWWHYPSYIKELMR